MTKTLPQLDIETLLKIEAHAPHMLTPEDRRALRMHRAAPVVKPVSIFGVLACACGLAFLIKSGAGH